MFGFLPGPTLCCAKATACYRAHFCGLCNVLRQDYGLWTRWLINRDSTFLAMLGAAQDSTVPEATRATCCNPWGEPRGLFQSGSAVRYAAAVTICGLSSKLDDDAGDERGAHRWLAAAGQRVCRDSADKAVGVLHGMDFPVSEVMRALQEDATSGQKGLALAESALPTSRAYSEIVAHTGRLAGVDAGMMAALRDIGARLGFLIYAKDAWDDWEQDRRRGRYNPLKRHVDEGERRGAVEPLAEEALASLRASFERLRLHRNRDLLSSMLVAGAETSVRKGLHIERAGGKDDDDAKKRKQRNKDNCCDNCCQGCDCSSDCPRCCRNCDACDCCGQSHGPSCDCDCNCCDCHCGP